jgi:imidazolonepropionase-like amidohydrolase
MLALRGAVWPGGDAPPIPNGVVLVADGRVAALGPAGAVEVPDGVEQINGVWVGPGIVDAHVHLAFGTAEAMRNGGAVAVRDLGAPPADARHWRGPAVAVAGPLLTAPGGYPSRSWGADGFATFVATPDDARDAVKALDVDVVKVALEPSGGPVPALDTVRAIVDAAHARGLAVTAHALSEPMVLRALDAGVDELCHTPCEPLSPQAVDRIADSGVPVVSTIQTLGRAAPANAKALHANGVRLIYGTDLGNAGTTTGVDQRELDRLADAGLGRHGALRAATEWSAQAAGFTGLTGRLATGGPAYAVVLAKDPLRHGWTQPLAVVTPYETWNAGSVR